MNEVIEYLRWLLPVRYWYHLRISDRYNKIPMAFVSWMELIQSCNYTVWQQIKNNWLRFLL